MRAFIFILKFLISACSIIFLIDLFDLASQYDSTTYSSSYTEQTESYIEFSDPQNEYPLIHDRIIEWLNDSPESTSLYTGSIYKQQSVSIAYSIYNVSPLQKVESQEFKLATDPSFQSAQSFTIAPDKRRIQLDYLYANTQYYYHLTVQLSDGASINAKGEFKTQNTPRILNIEGAVNVRDIGGWKTTNGMQIRQGLLYRGGEIDGAVQPSYRITENGLHQLQTVLGIRTDMDLRASDDVSPLGYPLDDRIKHTYYGAPAYESIFSEEGQEIIRQIFSDLAISEDYPIYLHCTYGLDRTGTVCYILELLLGVPEEDALRDYCLSLFTHRNATTQSINEFRSVFLHLDGATAQDKAEGYLLSIGVTQQEISAIRSIFLEPIH